MKTEIKPARKRVTPTFSKWEGPQRYVNRDPRPDLPFQEDFPRLVMTKGDRIVAWGLGFASLVILGLDVWWMYVK